MKKLIVILLTVTLSLFQYRSLAQDQQLIDSLQTQLKQLQGERTELRLGALTLRDSSIVKTLGKLCQAYMNNNPEKAMDYAKQALALSEQIVWKKGIASAYNNIGIVYSDQGNYSEALINYFTALKIREEIGDKRGVARSYQNNGSVYIAQGNYTEALKNTFAGLKIYEEIKDKEGISSAYNNIGNIYYFQGNYPEALKSYFSALKIYEEIGNKENQLDSYNNIGAIYGNQGNYPEALKSFFAVLKISKEIGNRILIATSYLNIGEVYTLQHNYPEALKNYFSALKIQEEMGVKGGIASSYNQIGNVYTKLNQAKEAKTWLQKALALSTAIGAKEIIKNAYSNLAEADSALGNYKNSLENYKLYILYKDSLFNEENNRKITQQQMQLEFDKKETLAKAEQEKKDLIVQEEKEKQQIIIYSISGGLILVLLLVIFVLRGYRQKQKANMALASKNELIAQQKRLVEEKHKEITDSINYAERIQRSLLASKELLNQNLGSQDNYFVFFKPKDIVSGDFYWASMLQNNRFAFITADSTGHGVPGAIMSILNIACLNEAVKEGHTSPPDILNRTRKEIISVLKRDGSADGGKDGMDCSLLVFDFKNKKLDLAAANNPVWIVRAVPQPDAVTSSSDGGAYREVNPETSSRYEQSSTRTDIQVIEIKPDKMPVGKHDKQDISFKQQEIDLQSGDVIYTLTDGFPDQFGGPNGKKFMSKNLREFLVANSHLSMPEQRQLLETTFTNWVGDLEQVDDVTLIGVRV